MLPYLLLCREDSPQRKHDLRAVFNAVRYVARTGGQWRYLPNDLPPWFVVYQQMQRWLRAGYFEKRMEDLRSLLREWSGRKASRRRWVSDSRMLQSTPESDTRAGYDGAKRRKGSKVHIAVDTLGYLLALTVILADQGDREQVAALAKEVQQVTGNNVELAYCGSRLHRAERFRGRATTRPAAGSSQASHGKTGASCCCRAAGSSPGRRLARDYAPRHHPQRASPTRLPRPHATKPR